MVDQDDADLSAEGGIELPQRPVAGLLCIPQLLIEKCDQTGKRDPDDLLAIAGARDSYALIGIGSATYDRTVTDAARQLVEAAAGRGCRRQSAEAVTDTRADCSVRILPLLATRHGHHMLEIAFGYSPAARELLGTSSNQEYVRTHVHDQSRKVNGVRYSGHRGAR